MTVLAMRRGSGSTLRARSLPRRRRRRFRVGRLDDPLLQELHLAVAQAGDAVDHDREGVPLAVAGVEVAADRADAFDEAALAEDALAQVGAAEAVLERAVH